MPRRLCPPHLPVPLQHPVVYELLYEANGGIDEFWPERGPWQESRIPTNLSAAKVYQRLPAAPDFEYGGYLTKTRIRYLACDPTSAETIRSKPCTFHSHPTNHPNADIPSVPDIYSFLKYRTRRAIMKRIVCGVLSAVFRDLRGKKHAVIRFY